MAKAGFGFWTPLDQLAPKSTSGYNPDYPVRAYDPVKAKLLLGGAGYPDGFKTTLTLQSTGQNLGVVIKNYLAVIGINVDLNIVDTGRYYAMQFTDGWQGLFQTVAAISPEYSVAWLHHFGRAPDVNLTWANPRISHALR
jgi:ABC-type transport system substrate-binding protein